MSCFEECWFELQMCMSAPVLAPKRQYRRGGSLAKVITYHIGALVHFMYNVTTDIMIKSPREIELRCESHYQ